MFLSTLRRRQWLQLGAAASLAPWGAAHAQARPGRTPDGAPLVVAQIADMSPGQQDVSRDFVVGARAAWQELNARGGIRGRAVEHRTIEVQGTGAALQAAWRSVVDDPACIALSGCVGDGAAAALAALAQTQPPAQPIAQVAPWLHNQGTASAGDTLFGIFPGYQEQIAHALHSLAIMGVQELGVVYASAAVRTQAQENIAQAAQALGLRVQALPLPGSSAQADRQLATPAQVIVLFAGGTPELHDFVRRLKLPPGRLCYIVALADVNLQVLAQMGVAQRNVSVIATQAVPLVTAGLPVVRAYRQALGRFFDEPPSPLGLAGFVAARCLAQVLQGMGGELTRAAVLAALRERQEMDLGGFTLAFHGRRRGRAYVTQSMLTADGRIVG